MAKLQTKHYWMIGTAAVLLTVGGIMLYRHNKKKKKESNDFGNSSFEGVRESISHRQPSTQQKEAFVEAEQQPVSEFPLRYGSKGNSVKDIQKYLNSTCPSELKKENLFPLEINGVWDERVESACMTCSSLKRNEIDGTSFKRIKRDLLSANIT